MLLKEAVTKSHSTRSDITVLAPAKINLVLRILDRRPDGFHNLWSIMHTVGLEDELQIGLQPEREDIQLSCAAADLASDRTNLVYRAAAAVMERLPKPVGLSIRLRKRIPMGAGLGGGSSDAAATLLGLNRLLQLEWPLADLAEIGQTLGSDVPFFLFAPSAVVTGRGETVRPVSMKGAGWAVLVNPGYGVNTKWAYQQLAATRGTVRPLSESHRRLDGQSTVTWEQVTAVGENDFEAPVFAAHPDLEDIKQSLLLGGASLALLSGSGATVFGLFADQPTAQRAAAQCVLNQKLKVFVVPIGSGPLVLR
jgi:4-diphosphocytidyl-2-C-methyl-D-erythritol kinase